MRRLCGLLIVLICTLASAAFAQLPLLDSLSRDPTDDTAYAPLPWSSLNGSTLPTPCVAGYFVQGIDAVSLAYDCQPALVIDGTPSDGDCPIYNSGTGTWQPGPCGGGSPLLILGPDYVFFNDGGTDKLMYYTGS